MKGNRMKQSFVQKIGQVRSALESRARVARQRLTDGSVRSSRTCLKYEVVLDAPASTVTAIFPLASRERIEDDHFVIELEPYNEIGHSVEPGEVNTSYSRLLQAPYVYVKNVAGTVKTQIIILDHQNISRLKMCVRVWKESALNVDLDDLGPLLISSTVESPKRTITKKATLI